MSLFFEPLTSILFIASMDLLSIIRICHTCETGPYSVFYRRGALSVEIGTHVIIAVGGAGEFVECCVKKCIEECGCVYVLKPTQPNFRPPTAGDSDKKKRKQKPPLQMRLHPTLQVKNPDDIRHYGQWCLSSQKMMRQAKRIGGLASV